MWMRYLQTTYVPTRHSACISVLCVPLLLLPPLPSAAAVVPGFFLLPRRIGGIAVRQPARQRSAWRSAVSCACRQFDTYTKIFTLDLPGSYGNRHVNRYIGKVVRYWCFPNARYCRHVDHIVARSLDSGKRQITSD